MRERSLDFREERQIGSPSSHLDSWRRTASCRTDGWRRRAS
jgi:hypothetical protein